MKTEIMGHTSAASAAAVLGSTWPGVSLVPPSVYPGPTVARP